MLLTLLKILSLGILRKGQKDRKRSIRLTVDLGSSQRAPRHMDHSISPKRGCPEPFKIRCKIYRRRRGTRTVSSTSSILAPLCLEIFGTKEEHFQPAAGKPQYMCTLNSVHRASLRGIDSSAVLFRIKGRNRYSLHTLVFQIDVIIHNGSPLFVSR